MLYDCSVIYNLGQNLLWLIAKVPIFSFHPGKNIQERSQTNACFPLPLSSVA